MKIYLFLQDNREDFFEDFNEEDLPPLQKELEEILSQFDTRTIKKHKLKEQIKEYTVLVDTTVTLFEK